MQYLRNIMSTKRTFLITGATKGIGYATVLRLNKLGHQVIGVARNEPQTQFPGHFYKSDLSDPIESNDFFDLINKKYSIDGVVNNVGIAIPESLDKITLDNFINVMDLNIRPVLQSMQIFTPGMVERKWGRIVNITSMAVLGVVNRASYSTAKAGLIGLTRTVALELATSGVTVNAVSPGPTETEMYRLKRPPGSEEARQSLQRIPMGRVGQPNEIAAAIEFFLSEDAGFITGQTLFVDGGGSVGRLPV